MNKYDYVRRLQEPSTWAAFAVLASFWGGQFADPGMSNTIVTVGVSVGGILGMFLREKAK